MRQRTIAVRGAARFETSDGESLAAYVHPPANKIGVLVKLEGGSEELARQLAMHISFAAPEWTTREDVPADVVEAEKEAEPTEQRDKAKEALTELFKEAKTGSDIAVAGAIHHGSRLDHDRP